MVKTKLDSELHTQLDNQMQEGEVAKSLRNAVVNGQSPLCINTGTGFF